MNLHDLENMHPDEILDALLKVVSNPQSLSDEQLNLLTGAVLPLADILDAEVQRREALDEARNGTKCEMCGLKIINARNHNCIKRLAKRLARKDKRYRLPSWATGTATTTTQESGEQVDGEWPDSLDE